MNILVTGGAGYIGSHACKALAKTGHAVTVLDDLVYGHEHSVKWGPLAKGDLNDSAFLKSVMSRGQFDAVLHFAARAYVGESVQDPLKYFKNNVCGGVNLLEAMQDEGVGRIVFSSSCAVYGNPCAPMDENHPLNPVNPYGDTKLMFERMLHWYGEASGMKWVALRYFNAAGADPDGELGEDHTPETHLIPLVLGAATGHRPPVKVFGADYPTPDGTAVRDYVHVSDLARAHVLALDYLTTGGDSRAFNLGTGRGSSVMEVIAEVGRVSGVKVPHVITDRRAGDPPSLVAQAGLAKEILKWTPERPALAQIIADAWRWHNKLISDTSKRGQ